MRRATCAMCAMCAMLVATAGCGGYIGTAHSISPTDLAGDPEWVLIPGFPTILQESERDCGVAVTSMVSGYWGAGKAVDATVLAVPADGLTAREVATLLEAGGLEAFVVEGQVADLVRETRSGRPVIVGLAKPHRGEVLLHYEVVVGVHTATGEIATVDPARGWQKNSRRGFSLEWDATGNVMIVAGTVAEATSPRAPGASR